MMRFFFVHDSRPKGTDRKVGRLDDVHIKTGESTFAGKSNQECV